jgi:hypothetical protein
MNAEQVQSYLPEILAGFNAILEENGINASVSHFMLTDPDDPNVEETREKIGSALDSIFERLEDKSSVGIAGCWVCCNAIECRICCIA